MIQTWVLSFSDMADANDLSSKFEFGYKNRFKKNGIADRALLSMQMWSGYAGVICVVYTHRYLCESPGYEGKGGGGPCPEPRVSYPSLIQTSSVQQQQQDPFSSRRSFWRSMQTQRLENVPCHHACQIFALDACGR